MTPIDITSIYLKVYNGQFAVGGTPTSEIVSQIYKIQEWKDYVRSDRYQTQMALIAFVAAYGVIHG